MLGVIMGVPLYTLLELNQIEAMLGRLIDPIHLVWSGLVALERLLSRRCDGWHVSFQKHIRHERRAANVDDWLLVGAVSS